MFLYYNPTKIMEYYQMGGGLASGGSIRGLVFFVSRIQFFFGSEIFFI